MAKQPDDRRLARDSRADRKAPEGAGRRSEFAKAIARAELGRFYWSERSASALREAMAKKPKR